MHQFYNVLKKNLLFNNINEENLGDILSCFKAYVMHFNKNEIIRPPETLVTETGIIIKGVVYLTKTDVSGKRAIMSKLAVGESFGEAISLTGAENSPISVLSATNSTIIFIPTIKILEACSPPCRFHMQLTENIVKILAIKNLTLQMKNDILSQKNMREKLLLYLEYESKTAKSKTFSIHFSREELADFLSVNPSAMSRELGEMRDEGLLTFYKNSFKLK